MSNRLLVAHDYETLRQALNERRLALKMTLLDLDAKALLPDGYSGHVLGRNRNFGATSLGPLLAALGVKIALVEAEQPGSGKTFKVNAIKDSFLRARLAEFGRRGAAARRAKMTPMEWKAFCVKGAKASALKRAQKKANAEKAARLHGPRDAYLKRRRAAQAADGPVEN